MFGFTENATIKNLNVSVNLTCKHSEDNAYSGDGVGAIVGFAKDGLVLENCNVAGTINGGYDGVGGLVGRSQQYTENKPIVIKNCINAANITATTKVAGIIGYATGVNLNLTIDSCENQGALKVEGFAKTNNSSYIAGIALYGWANTSNESTSKPNYVTITNNKNKSNIESCATINLAGKKDRHIYSYIAGSISYAFNNNFHSYNFTGNENIGATIKYGGSVATDAVVCLLNQIYPTYQAKHEYNGKTYTVPVQE